MLDIARFARRALGASAALAVAACASSSPFGSASSVELTFVGAAQTWDLNKDNLVACDEWKRYTDEIYQSSDADKDGVITEGGEYARVTKQDKLFETVGFKYFDVNGDGKLSPGEMGQKPNPAFALLDKNKDCQLDSYEMVQTRGPQPKAKDTYGEAPDLPK